MKRVGCLFICAVGLLTAALLVLMLIQVYNFPAWHFVWFSEELEPDSAARRPPADQQVQGVNQPPGQQAEPTAILTPTPAATATSTPPASASETPTLATEGEKQPIKPVQFLESDCSCIGLQPDPQAPAPMISDGRLTCNFAWAALVVGGTPGDWNQVQSSIAPWKTLADARQRLAADGKQLRSSGAKGMWDQDSLFYGEKRGTAGFYYGEARVVYEEGYYLSLHLRGYYESGEDQVRSIFEKADQCMRAAIER